MIKVVDEVTGTAIKIEVIGKPYQYQVRIGKVGTWTVARGRTAGTVKSGDKWDRPMYVKNIKQAIEVALDAISESEGIPKDQIKLTGADAWKALIDEEAKRVRLIEAINVEYGKLIEEHGKDLAGLTKFLAGKLGKELVEEDDADPDAEDETANSAAVYADEEPSLFPKMEQRLKEAGEV